MSEALSPVSQDQGPLTTMSQSQVGPSQEQEKLQKLIEQQLEDIAQQIAGLEKQAVGLQQQAAGLQKQIVVLSQWKNDNTLPQNETEVMVVKKQRSSCCRTLGKAVFFTTLLVSVISISAYIGYTNSPAFSQKVDGAAESINGYTSNKTNPFFDYMKSGNAIKDAALLFANTKNITLSTLGKFKLPSIEPIRKLVCRPTS